MFINQIFEKKKKKRRNCASTENDNHFYISAFNLHIPKSLPIDAARRLRDKYYATQLTITARARFGGHQTRKLVWVPPSGQATAFVLARSLHPD